MVLGIEHWDQLVMTARHGVGGFAGAPASDPKAMVGLVADLRTCFTVARLSRVKPSVAHDENVHDMARLLRLTTVDG